MSKLHLFLLTYLGLHSLALPVFGSFRYLTLACKYIPVRTNPYPLSNRIIDKRAKVGKNSITCGPFKHQVSISDEDSLSEIALSGASKLAYDRIFPSVRRRIGTHRIS